MGKDKTGKSKQIRATDLVRASLRIRHENSKLYVSCCIDIEEHSSHIFVQKIRKKSRVKKIHKVLQASMLM